MGAGQRQVLGVLLPGNKQGKMENRERLKVAVGGALQTEGQMEERDMCSQQARGATIPRLG